MIMESGLPPVPPPNDDSLLIDQDAIVVRPPNPFTSQSKPNPFLAFNVSQKQFTQPLKLKSASRTKFVDLNFSNFPYQRKRSSSDRMRDLDTTRYYTPLPDERSTFNIPESSERLSLHTIHGLMVLCGGCAGTRFSSEEIQTISSTLDPLQRDFYRMEAHFNSMTNVAKRHILTEDSSPISNDDSNDATATSNNHVSKMVVQEKVKLFHDLADAYTIHVIQLQLIVKTKQINFQLLKESTNQLQDNLILFDKDPDSGKGQGTAIPVWLSTLLDKYLDDFPPLPPKKKDTLPTIGKFSAFLSCCLFDFIVCKTEQEMALVELIHASNDTQITIPYCQSLQDLRSFLASQPLLLLSQKYWAKRFFNFLSKLTELRTVPKDEKSCYCFSEFL